MFNLNTNIVINSNQEVFIFQLSNDGEIIYTIYDSSLTLFDSNLLHEKNIIKYSILIDENDIIHLVALVNTGELNYFKYIEEKWIKATIAKFDTKSNMYNQIEILMIKNKIHIIYNYSNFINSNIWTIQHVIYGDEERHNAIRYISKRTPDLFVVDVDNQGTIHLLYRSNPNNPQIHHIFYSHYTKAWSSLSKQISSDNCNNLLPFLLIDSQNNLHGIWVEVMNDKYKLKYLKMKSSGKEKYIWKDISFPYIQLSDYPPIIIEEDNKLKLIYLSNNTIQFLYSLDHGESWVKGENSENPTKNIMLIRVKSNINRINKINYIYSNISDSPILYFLDLLPYKKDFDTTDSILPETIIPSETKDNEPNLEATETSISIYDELYNKIESILDNHNNTQSILNQILDNQENIIDKINNIQKSIDIKKDSFINKLFN